MADALGGTRPLVLVQLDSGSQASVFDGVVAVDSGVSHLFRHAGVRPEEVRDIVHGCIFTRGAADLRSTALFIGGPDVEAARLILEAARAAFFGSFRVSILFDPNGANTTAAAAVLAAVEGLGGSVEGVRSVVLGGTGPVGSRVARLLAGLGADVAIGSRSLERARDAASRIGAFAGRPVDAFASETPEGRAEGIREAALVVAAGTAGALLLPKVEREGLASLRVLIDLNAVPPEGIQGVEAMDKGTARGEVRAWGALGVGGAKMKIHKAAIRALFTSNDQVLDAEEILAIGRAIR